MEKVSIGPLTILCWCLGALFTGALVFLGIMTWDQLMVPFISMFIIGILLTLMATKLSFTRESVFTPKVGIAILAGVVLLAADAILLKTMLGFTISQYDNVLVALLFSIFEESLFLGIVALLAGMGMPDVYNLLVTTIVFVPLHCLVYPAALPYTIFLIIGRVILTSLTLITDNSDTAFGSHALYNIIVTMGAIF